MRRVLALVVLSVGAAVGVSVADAGIPAHAGYSLAQAYDAGIISAGQLAEGFGCSPAGLGTIVCHPTDGMPWCAEHPGPAPNFDPEAFAPLALQGTLPKRVLALRAHVTECMVSPYDEGIIVGFRSVPASPFLPYLR